MHWGRGGLRRKMHVKLNRLYHCSICLYRGDFIGHVVAFGLLASQGKKIVFTLTRTQRKRLWLILGLLIIAGTIVGLVLFALNQNLNLYFTPIEIKRQKIALHKPIRLGGVVTPGSVQRKADLSVQFKVTDFEETILVSYQGVLPNLFKEGQGVVAVGQLTAPNHFKATQILAKHDENYRPPTPKEAQTK